MMEQEGKYATDTDMAKFDREKFRCGFCGKYFHSGSYYRRIYTNNVLTFAGNPYACAHCDCGDDEIMIATWKVLWREYMELYATRLWYFVEYSSKFEIPEKLKEDVGFDE